MPDRLKLTPAAESAHQLDLGLSVSVTPTAAHTAYCDGCNATGTDGTRHDPWCPVDRVATQIRDAEARRDRTRRQRAEFDAARARGLTARHAQKLRHLRDRDSLPVTEPPDAA